MRTLFVLASALMLLVANGCGGDSHESLGKEGLSTMKDMVDVLKGVKDEASAKSAKPQLQTLMDKLKSIDERQSKLPAVTDAEKKEMESKYGEDGKQVMQQFMSEMMRVAMIPGAGEMLQGLDMKGMK